MSLDESGPRKFKDIQYIAKIQLDLLTKYIHQTGIGMKNIPMSLEI